MRRTLNHGIIITIVILLICTGMHGQDLSPEMLPPPIFSHSEGQFNTPFEISFESYEGVSIYYTTDGSVPVDTAAILFIGPITIDRTIVVRARSYSPGYAPSTIVTKVYTRIADEVVSFNSDLPLVILHQFDSPISSSIQTPAYLTVIDHTSGDRTWLSGDISLQSRIVTNIRGSSSQQFPKQQYAIRLVDDYDENRNEPLLGMPSENNWILYAPYSDKTLMRNAVAYRLSRDMGWYAPRTRFVELFLHEGDGPVTDEHYHGVYMLVERIKWDNNRVDIEKLTPEDDTEPEITGGYIIQNDRDVHITTARGSGFALVRPQDWDITDAQREWLKGYLDEFESVLFGPEFMDSDNGYEAFINSDSFIDHHLITELCKEIDGYRLSTFMYKDREGKLIMGPVWDFNLSLGNANYNRGWDPEGWYYSVINQNQYLYGWYTRLFEDQEFRQRYIDRWWSLRQTVFSYEYITGIIDYYYALLREAQERNFERWPVLGTYVWPNPAGFQLRVTYEKEVDWMIDWIQSRLAWIDSQMEDNPLNTLIHNWYFSTDLANDTPFETLEATYGTMNGGRIEYHSALAGYPYDPTHENWRKASMERRNRPTSLNYHPQGNNGMLYDENEMRGLQIKQPFRVDAGENTMVFYLPTLGYENIVFSFAAADEGAAEKLIIDYSVGSPGSGWVTEGLSSDTMTLSEDYMLYAIDFSEIETVDNNPDFKIRIRFDGEDMAIDEGYRVTFNNIALLGTPITVHVFERAQHTITDFHLEQNYPNPFNPSTVIRFGIPERSNITLTVYNMLGQRVKVLVDEVFETGIHEVTFDASHFPSGVYVYSLRAGDRVHSKKLLYVR
jgi:hypothetical protein